MEKETDGKSCGCQGKRCEVCTFLEEKSTFTNKEGSDTYKIREGLHLDCNSENLVYLITYKKGKKQHVGSCITRFRKRFNNYRLLGLLAISEIISGLAGTLGDCRMSQFIHYD